MDRARGAFVRSLQPRDKKKSGEKKRAAFVQNTRETSRAFPEQPLCVPGPLKVDVLMTHKSISQRARVGEQHFSLRA